MVMKIRTETSICNKDQITQYQIKNQSSFIWWKKVPRLSQTQRWFTEYYSVDRICSIITM